MKVDFFIVAKLFPLGIYPAPKNSSNLKRFVRNSEDIIIDVEGQMNIVHESDNIEVEKQQSQT